MAVITVNPIVPMSSVWTVKRLTNHIRVVTGELDAEKVQNSHIRNHINTAISYLAEIINEAEKPDYGVAWLCTQEATPHISGLDWIDLSTPLQVQTSVAYERNFPQNKHVSSQFIIPFNFLHSIDYLSCKASTVLGEQNDPADVMGRNCRLLVLDEMTTLSNGFNDQYRQDICYVPYGREILLYFGANITTAATVAPDNTDTFYERPYHFVLWGKRKPLLDNLLPENDADTSWDTYVDISDEHMRLLILLVQKYVYESLSKAVEPNITQTIAQEIQLLKGVEAEEKQEEIVKRNKK